MRANYDIALAVAETYPFALMYASPQLRCSVPLWLAAVPRAPMSLASAPPAVRSDHTIVACLAENGFKFEPLEGMEGGAVYVISMDDSDDSE